MKISVVTAVFNAERTIGDAIESVAGQTHEDVEHVIIEGASSDGSLAAIEAAAHPRMVLVSEPDKGIYDALNKGVARATGDIVGFVHADDFLANPDVLAKVAAAFADPAVEAVYADLEYVSQADTTRVVRHWATGPFSPSKLKRGWMPAHPTLYLRRSVYEGAGTFDTTFAIAADYDFILRVFSQTTEERCHYLPEVTYRMRLGGVSNRNLAKIRQKTAEDYRALRRNNIGGVGALLWKNLSKLRQFRA